MEHLVQLQVDGLLAVEVDLLGKILVNRARAEQAVVVEELWQGRKIYRHSAEMRLPAEVEVEDNLHLTAQGQAAPVSSLSVTHMSDK